MTANAGLIFKNNPLSENSKFFDGNTGQSVTLEELAERRRVEQIQKFQENSSSEINWQIISSKLDDLLNDDDYDEDCLAPTKRIFDSVEKLLFEINNFLGYEMSIPNFIIPDGEGGIRIEWRLNNKHLRLVLSGKQTYLYFEQNHKGHILPQFNEIQLIEKLRWLNEE